MTENGSNPERSDWTAEEKARCISVREAADILGVSNGFLYRLIEQGEFPPAVRVGSRVQVHCRALVTWVEQGGSSRAIPPVDEDIELRAVTRRRRSARRHG